MNKITPVRSITLGHRQDQSHTNIGLWYEVILVRKRPASDGTGSKEPVTSIAFVIAPGEKQAIAQVARNAFPDGPIIGTEEDEKNLTATATRIPLQIRGWGATTF
jgi:hypothetical protein